jgi:outer membrane protein OmpA-like peptidoglycan-associated protein
MHTFKLFLLLVNCFIFSTIYSQSGRLKEANKLYNKMAYYHAAVAYEDVLARGVDSTYIARNIADCYDKIENNTKAVAWYEHIDRRFILNQHQLLRYAMVLRQLKSYERSLEKFKEYESLYGATDLTRKKIAEHYLLEFFSEDAGRFQIRNQSIVNTEGSDFGVSWFQSGQVLVSTARKSTNLKRGGLDRVGDKFYGLAYASVDENGDIGKAKKLKGNTSFHDGPAIYDPNSNYVYFTRSNYIKRNKAYDKGDVMRLKILRAEISTKKKLVNIIELPINSDEFSTGHPALSADGKTLYFSSDRPGGFGGTDIWKVSIADDGSTGEPVNLGSTVNTSQNEMFPYVDSESNMLFFSSDGHTGLGGLDVFFGYLNADHSAISNLTNMAAPINTEFDDFGFIIDKALEQGYFVSNRDGGIGDDDIYSFKMLKRFEPFLAVEGIVSDCTTKKLLAGTRVSLQNHLGKEITNAVVDDDGFYRFVLSASQAQEYKLSAVLKEYSEGKESFDISEIPDGKKIVRRDICLVGVNDGTELFTGNELALEVLVRDKSTKEPISSAKVSAFDVLSGKYIANDFTDSIGIYYAPIINKRILDDLIYAIRASKENYSSKKIDYAGIYLKNDVIRVVIELDKGSFSSPGQEIIDCIGNRIVLNNIYFDLDKHFIREDAKPELDKIVELLNRCPNMRMEVGSHTDCRASYAYNDALSRRRANATVNYIKARITNPHRIKPKGYGERKLAEPCPCEPSNQSDCSEEQHQLNRRTEFTILSVGQPKQSTVAIPEVTNSEKQEVNTQNTIDQFTEGDTYTIKEGETLYRVFVNTGVSVNELKRLNNLKSNTVHVGQVLRVR